MSGRGGGSGSRDGGPSEDLEFYERHGIPAGWQDSELHRLACAHVRGMSEIELCDRLWACALASAQNRLNPWRTQDIADKVRRAADFIAREDQAVRVAMADWKAYIEGGRRD